MKRIAVFLSGCGVYDGSEIHEATLSLLAIAKQGATYSLFAPDINQHHVINHLTGEVMNETRNVLVESARIARGKISPISAFSAEEFDGLLLPGGFGAAKNLSKWAFEGPGTDVIPEIKDAILSMVRVKKPVGALCISPVLLTKTVDGPRITIGMDEGDAAAVNKTGATHVKANHGEVVIDEKYKFVTTPCYMLNATIDQIWDGAWNVVHEMLKMM